MTYMATITSKNQVTIPTQIAKKMKYKKNQKIHFSAEEGRVYIETPVEMINRLAGSFPLPDKFKNMDLDELIEVSKQKHFSQKIKKEELIPLSNK